jgi:hypothetical protein
MSIARAIAREVRPSMNRRPGSKPRTGAARHAESDASKARRLADELLRLRTS